MNPLIGRLRAALRRFAGATGGNTVVVFALSFIPLVGLTGAAVDYSRANAIQTAMQAAADTTALMVAQNAAAETAASVQTTANNYYKALFTRTDAQNVQVTGTYSNTSGSTVLISATATYRTSFMGMMGFQNLSLAAQSTASFGNSRLRVALVLDNTGSMADSGKMTALKNALTNTTSGLLAQLQAAVTNPGDVYVSIVPFVKDVDVGSSNYSQNWIYWDDAAHQDNTSWNAQNGTCSQSTYNDRASCVTPGSCSISGNTTQSSCQAATTGSCNNTQETTQASCVATGSCSISSHHSHSSCTTAHGTWTTPAVWTTTAGVWTPNNTWTVDNHNTWGGCVMDRGDPGGPDTGNYDTNVVAPTTTTTATQFPAEQYSTCPQSVMGLNYNWSSMTTLVNNMSPNGSTNQNIGLALGWMSLTGGGPFTVPAMDPNYTYQQVIILLTDGLNTQDRWYGNGSTTSTQVDARQYITCDNIKNGGVTIYTIQVNTDGSPTSSLLQYCAGTRAGSGDSSKFFLLTSSSQIVSVFNQIGTQLSQLRIAK